MMSPAGILTLHRASFEATPFGKLLARMVGSGIQEHSHSFFGAPPCPRGLEELEEFFSKRIYVKSAP